jgi:hypothetical protein
MIVSSDRDSNNSSPRTSFNIPTIRHSCGEKQKPGTNKCFVLGFGRELNSLIKEFEERHGLMLRGTQKMSKSEND